MHNAVIEKRELRQRPNGLDRQKKKFTSNEHAGSGERAK